METSNARELFRARFSTLLDDSGVTAREVADRVNKIRPRTVTDERISAWRTGPGVPAKESTEKFLLVVGVLNGLVKARLAAGDQVSSPLMEPGWRKLLKEARDTPLPKTTGGPGNLRDPDEDGLARVLGGRMGVPPLPESFRSRPEAHETIVRLLMEEPATDRVPVVALFGMGGTGKTLLAQAAARDPRIGPQPKGQAPLMVPRFGLVLWLRAGERDAAACQADLLAALEVPVPGNDVEAGARALRRRLSGARCLLVLDDLTSNDQRLALDVCGSGSVILTTTRDRGTVPYGQREFPVGMLDPAEAREVLAAYAGVPPDDLPPEAEEVLAGCSGLPLALAICGAMVSRECSWADMTALLRDPAPAALQMTFDDYRHTSLAAAIEASTGTFDKATRQRYEELAVFAGRGPVPVSVAARLWAPRLDADESRDTIMRLARRSLLTFRRDNSTFVLHDLLYKYARHQAAERLPGLHLKLAEAFLEAWGGLDRGLPGALSASGPAGGPSQDGDYALGHLPGHLVQAGRDDLLHALLAAESGPGGQVNTWFEVHDRLDRTAGYLLDVNLARERAEKATDQAASPAGRVQGVALEIRYALVRSSIASLADTIPAEFLAALVSRGVWKFPKAQAYAEVMPDAENRSRALCRLAEFRRPGEAARARLVDLSSQAAGSIANAPSRAIQYALLVRLAAEPQQQNTLLERALEAANSPHQGSWATRAWVFCAVAGALPQRAKRALRRGVRRKNELEADSYREAMIAALPVLPDLREDVLALARTSEDRNLRSKALKAVLASSSREERAALASERLAAYDPEQEWSHSSIVEELAQYLPQDELDGLAEMALAGAGPIETPVETVIILAAVLPYLPEAKKRAARDQAMQIVRERQYSLLRDHLVALASSIPEPERTPLLEEITDALFAEHPSSAVWMLCQMAETVGSLPEHLQRRAVEAVDSANPPEDALNRLAPYLTPGLLRQAITRRPAGDPLAWTRAFIRLMPGQPEDTLRQALDLIATLDSPADRAGLLADLAPHLPDSLIGTAAQAIGDGTGPEREARLLALLASRATGPEREILDRRARDRAAADDHPHRYYKALAELATGPDQLAAVLDLQCALDREAHHRPRWPQDPVPLPDQLTDQAADLARAHSSLPPDQLTDQPPAILGWADEAHGPCLLAHALAALVPYSMPGKRTELLREAAVTVLAPHGHPDDIDCDGLDALRRAADLVPPEARLPLPEGHITEPVTDLGSLERMRQLSVLLAYLPGDQHADLLEDALTCLAAMSSHWDTGWIANHAQDDFDTIAPYLSPDARRRAAELARRFPDRSDQADVLAMLAAHADPATQPSILREAVTTMGTLTKTYELQRPLRLLNPIMEEPQATELLDRLLEAARDERHSNLSIYQSSIPWFLRSLAPSLLPRAAEGTAKVRTAPDRAAASKAIALAADAAHHGPWSKYWRTAFADAATAGRPAVLALITDLPLQQRESIAPHVAQAILDAKRWWPGTIRA
jgi:hypothetical protein